MCETNKSANLIQKSTTLRKECTISWGIEAYNKSERKVDGVISPECCLYITSFWQPTMCNALAYEDQQFE